MVGNLLEYWAIRSFKRELAILAFFFWASLSVKVFFYSTVEIINALGAAYGTASMSSWLYIAGAFGLDYYSKMGNQPPPQLGGPFIPPIVTPTGVLPKVPKAGGN